MEIKREGLQLKNNLLRFFSIDRTLMPTHCTHFPKHSTLPFTKHRTHSRYNTAQKNTKHCSDNLFSHEISVTNVSTFIHHLEKQVEKSLGSMHTMIQCLVSPETYEQLFFAPVYLGVNISGRSPIVSIQMRHYTSSGSQLATVLSHHLMQL